MTVTAFPAVGHEAGPSPHAQFLSEFNAASSSDKATVSTYAEFLAAYDSAVAGNIDYIGINNLTIPSLQLYSSRLITAVRSSGNEIKIGAINKHGVIVGGTDASSVYTNNLIHFSGAQYVNFYGFAMQYCARAANDCRIIRFENGAQNNLIADFKFVNTGYITSVSGGLTIPIQVVQGSHNNTLSHPWFVNYDGTRVTTDLWELGTWDGSIRIFEINRVGSTCIVRFREADGFIPSAGETCYFYGMTQSEYNGAHVVDSINLNGNNSTLNFSFFSGETPTTPATFESELGIGEMRRALWVPSTGLTVEYPSYQNCTHGGTVGKNGTTRIQRPHVHETATRHLKSWDDGCDNMNWFMQDKCGGTIIEDNFGISAQGTYIARDGDNKSIDGLMRPFCDMDIEGEGHDLQNLAYRQLTVTEGGAFDGTNNGTAANDNIVPDVDDVSITRYISTGNSFNNRVGLSQGYGSLLTNNPPTNVAFSRGIHLWAGAGASITAPGKILPGYFTDNTITFDEIHTYLSGGGSIGYTPTNYTTGDPSLLGPIMPTSDSIAATGADSGAFDVRGTADPDALGPVQFVDPDYLFANTFTGSADASALTTTPETNDTGNDPITGAIIPTLDGNGAMQGVTGSAYGLNLGSTEQHFEMISSAGGANNRVSILIGSNIAGTAGIRFELSQNEQLMRYYELAVSDTTPIMTIKLNNLFSYAGISGSSQVRWWVTKKGNDFVPVVLGFPLAGVTRTGLTGTYGWAIFNSQVNTAARIYSVSAATDQASGGGTPSVEPEVIIDFAGTGTTNANVVGSALTIGDSIATFDTTAAGAFQFGGGGWRANVNTASSRIVIEFVPTATVEADISLKVELISTGAPSSDDPVTLSLRGTDNANLYGLAIYTGTHRFYKTVTGTDSALTSAASHTNLAGTSGTPQVLEFKIVDNSTPHPVLQFLVDDVLIEEFEDTGDTFTAGGSIAIGVGNQFVAGDDIAAAWILRRVIVTHYPVTVPPAASSPVIESAPTVDPLATFDTILGLRATVQDQSNQYFVVHNEAADYSNDEDGIDDIIAGNAPSGSSVTTADNDETPVGAATEKFFQITGLDDLDSSSPAKAPAEVGWGWTATTPDTPDIKMNVPFVGRLVLPAPVADETSFDPQNPVPGDYYRIQFTDVSVLSSDGFVKTRWPNITNNSIVEFPYLTDGGYITSISLTGVLSVDTDGNPDTISGINMWDYTSRSWQENTTTGYEYEIAGSTPYVTTSIIFNDNFAPYGQGTQVSYRGYFNGRVSSPDSQTPDFTGIGFLNSESKLAFDAPDVGSIWLQIYRQDANDQDLDEIWSGYVEAV